MLVTLHVCLNDTEKCSFEVRALACSALDLIQK